MRTFETRKNINKTQYKEKYNEKNVDISTDGKLSCEKSLFLKKSNYGWDGDY